MTFPKDGNSVRFLSARMIAVVARISCYRRLVALLTAHFDLDAAFLCIRLKAKEKLQDTFAVGLAASFFVKPRDSCKKWPLSEG